MRRFTATGRSPSATPLIDRIDIHVEVPAVPHSQLLGSQRGTDSLSMRQQVLAARRLQRQRNGSDLKPNAALSGKELDRLAALDAPGKEMMKQAMSEMGLSARAYDKVRRVARTIADLEQSEKVQPQHVAEATSAPGRGVLRGALWQRAA